MLRAFQLNRAVVRWPYGVSLYGQTEIVEEIDGSVRVGGFTAWSRAKTRTETLRSHRSPSCGTNCCGGLLARSGWCSVRMGLPSRLSNSPTSLYLSRSSCGPVIRSSTPWTTRTSGELCEMKYRMCVDYGMLDFDVTTGAIA